MADEIFKDEILKTKQPLANKAQVVDAFVKATGDHFVDFNTLP